MGWYANTLEMIREVAGTAAIECPRGWGQVQFVSSVWVVPPLGGVDRKCPIAGAESCSTCTYASNPDAFRLTDQLAELQRLRDDGTLDTAEHDRRRTAVLRLHPDERRRPQRVAAWVLGPLGALITLAGIALVVTVHPGFWSLAGGGAILLSIAFSCFMISRPDGTS